MPGSENPNDEEYVGQDVDSQAEIPSIIVPVVTPSAVQKFPNCGPLLETVGVKNGRETDCAVGTIIQGQGEGQWSAGVFKAETYITFFLS